jgi:hypothetical protein
MEFWPREQFFESSCHHLYVLKLQRPRDLSEEGALASLGFDERGPQPLNGNPDGEPRRPAARTQVNQSCLARYAHARCGKNRFNNQPVYGVIPGRIHLQ